MFSAFERFVALRYLKGLKGQGRESGFLRFISYVAIAGVAVGVGALLLTFTIVHGFSQAIEQKIVGFGAHVQVERLKDAPLKDVRRKAERLRGFEHVERVAPIVQEFALLRRSAQQIDGAAIWGVNRPPSYLAKHLKAGRFTFEPDSAGHPGIVIGQQLADELGAHVGDKITIFSMRSQGKHAQAHALRQPRVRQFRINGLYETLLADFDAVNVFTSIQVARDLFDYAPGTATRFDITLDDFGKAKAVASAVEEQFSSSVMALTIQQVYPGLFAWVNLQEGIIPVVVGVIVIVAAFNILGTLLMIILEKTSEIGILASMGASGKRLRRLFLSLGLLIGAIGTGIGEGVALILALLQQRYNLISLPAKAYYVSTAPVKLVGSDFLIVAVFSLLLCAAAAYFPARFAAKIEPIRVIRFR